jgi:hypothetical protein
VVVVAPEMAVRKETAVVVAVVAPMPRKFSMRAIWLQRPTPRLAPPAHLELVLPALQTREATVGPVRQVASPARLTAPVLFIPKAMVVAVGPVVVKPARPAEQAVVPVAQVQSVPRLTYLIQVVRVEGRPAVRLMQV